jgi:putative SOS response-associated peptidase YedK
MFQRAFERKRCLFPASGYYEWHPVDGGKQPFYFTSPASPILSIAGLWDGWKEIETGDRVMSATMIITDANDFVSPIHDRMPVLLEPDQFAPWLAGDVGNEIMVPAANDRLRVWPVSRRVNKVGNGEDPTLIEQVAA